MAYRRELGWQQNVANPVLRTQHIRKCQRQEAIDPPRRRSVQSITGVQRAFQSRAKEQVVVHHPRKALGATRVRHLKAPLATLVHHPERQRRVAETRRRRPLATTTLLRGVHDRCFRDVLQQRWTQAALRCTGWQSRGRAHVRPNGRGTRGVPLHGDAAQADDELPRRLVHRPRAQLVDLPQRLPQPCVGDVVQSNDAPTETWHLKEVAANMEGHIARTRSLKRRNTMTGERGTYKVAVQRVTRTAWYELPLRCTRGMKHASSVRCLTARSASLRLNRFRSASISPFSSTLYTDGRQSP